MQPARPVPMPAVIATVAAAVAVGLLSTFALVRPPASAGSWLLWPGFDGAALNALIAGHAVLAIALSPLVVFTGIRRDDAFRAIASFFALSCLAVLAGLFLTTAAANVVSPQAPTMVQIYVGLLALQAVVLGYFTLAGRLNTALVTPLRSIGRGVVQASRARAESRDKAARQARNKTVRKKTMEMDNTCRSGEKAPTGAPNTGMATADAVPCPNCDQLNPPSVQHCHHCGTSTAPDRPAHAQVIYPGEVPYRRHRVGIGNLLQRPTRSNRQS
jgi:hypothetical protein